MALAAVLDRPLPVRRTPDIDIHRLAAGGLPSPREEGMKRVRRKILGAAVEIRVRKDGTIRLKVDHPSNDPGTETMIAGLVMYAIQAISDLDWKPGSLFWRDDP